MPSAAEVKEGKGGTSRETAHRFLSQLWGRWKALKLIRDCILIEIIWKMRLCLKVPGKTKGSAKTCFSLKEGELAREGLIGNGVSTKLSYSYWKPPAWLPHSRAWAQCAEITAAGISATVWGLEKTESQRLTYLDLFGHNAIITFNTHPDLNNIGSLAYCFFSKLVTTSSKKLIEIT